MTLPPPRKFRPPIGAQKGSRHGVAGCLASEKPEFLRTHFLLLAELHRSPQGRLGKDGSRELLVRLLRSRLPPPLAGRCAGGGGPDGPCRTAPLGVGSGEEVLAVKWWPIGLRRGGC